MRLRRLLHAAGLRYRVHVRVPGTRRTIDIAFPSALVAVDVRGCFWHACPLHGSAPTANSDWWRSKLQATRTRDEDTLARLRALGWATLVVWEHEASEVAAERVAAVVASRRASGATADGGS